MLNTLSKKKILILGGAFQHCKLVETAKKLGIITYVIDYLPFEKSPAKQIADFHFEYDIADYDSIISLCRREHIDGVLSAYIDVCQLPYQHICEELNLPCFGTKEQFGILTNKKKFKKKCEEYGVDTIAEYDENDFVDESECKATFPIFVKPADSRGSRGQTICKSFSEIGEAIREAKKESISGEIIIEAYMGDKPDFALTYFVIDGNPILYRTCDRYLGTVSDRMDRSSICTISPSRFTDMYLEKVNRKVQELIRGIGIKNGPVFMQGFVDGNTIKFYDPGLRCAGGEFDRLYEKITEINICQSLLEFALTGKLLLDPDLLSDYIKLKGRVATLLFLVLRPGKIKNISGVENIKDIPAVVSYFQRADVGDSIGNRFDVTQRLGEVDFVSNNIEELKDTVNMIYDNIHVLDNDGKEMIFSKMDCKRILLLENK